MMPASADALYITQNHPQSACSPSVAGTKLDPQINAFGPEIYASSVGEEI